MRLIAVPIARAKAGATPVSTFLAQRTPIKPSFTSHKLAEAKSAANATSTAAATSAQSVPKEEEKPPLSKRLLERASKFWIDLGREDQTSTFDWKRRTYRTGERLMDQIEYEEWALKAVDPAIGPGLSAPEGKGRREDRREARADGTETALRDVPLLFPSRFLSGPGLLNSLTKLTASRQPHHRQRLIWCVVGMPFTIPFALVPIIPNLPFFYLVWRAWSHYRAYQSSKYLNDLLAQNRITPQASEELDRILALAMPSVSQAEAAKSTDASTLASTSSAKETSNAIAPIDPDESVESLLILKPHHIVELSKVFNMDRQLPIDMARARLQTIKAIKAKNLDKLHAAAELGSERKANAEEKS